MFVVAPSGEVSTITYTATAGSISRRTDAKNMRSAVDEQLCSPAAAAAAIEQQVPLPACVRRLVTTSDRSSCASAMRMRQPPQPSPPTPKYRLHQAAASPLQCLTHAMILGARAEKRDVESFPIATVRAAIYQRRGIREYRRLPADIYCAVRPSVSWLFRQFGIVRAVRLR
jgi:hypothetical protein